MDAQAPSPEWDQIESAVKTTLLDWAAELDTGRKFWWMDWHYIIRDVLVAVKTGEAVTYPDDDEPD